MKQYKNDDNVSEIIWKNKENIKELLQHIPTGLSKISVISQPEWDKDPQDSGTIAFIIGDVPENNALLLIAGSSNEEIALKKWVETELKGKIQLTDGTPTSSAEFLFKSNGHVVKGTLNDIQDFIDLVNAVVKNQMDIQHLQAIITTLQAGGMDLKIYTGTNASDVSNFPTQRPDKTPLQNGDYGMLKYVVKATDPTEVDKSIYQYFVYDSGSWNPIGMPMDTHPHSATWANQALSNLTGWTIEEHEIKTGETDKTIITDIKTEYITYSIITSQDGQQNEYITVFRSVKGEPDKGIVQRKPLTKTETFDFMSAEDKGKLTYIGHSLPIPERGKDYNNTDKPEININDYAANTDGTLDRLFIQTQLPSTASSTQTYKFKDRGELVYTKGTYAGTQNLHMTITYVKTTITKETIKVPTFTKKKILVQTPVIVGDRP